MDEGVRAEASQWLTSDGSGEPGEDRRLTEFYCRCGAESRQSSDVRQGDVVLRCASCDRSLVVPCLNERRVGATVMRGRLRPTIAPGVLVALLGLLLLSVLFIVPICLGVAVALVVALRAGRAKPRTGSMRVLFLRPHLSDYRLRRTGAVDFFAKNPDRTFTSLEWLLAASANVRLVKLGVPGDRSYREEILVPDRDRWQAQVETELAACDLVLVRPGDSAGIRWELERILNAKQGHRPPVAIILPPGSRGDTVAAWNSLAAQFGTLPSLSPQAMFDPVLYYVDIECDVQHWFVSVRTLTHSIPDSGTYVEAVEALARRRDRRKI